MVLRIKLAFSLTFFLILFSACTPESIISYGALGLGKGKILVVNSDVAAPLSYTISLYDIDGNFLTILKDYTTSGAQPRGITAVDPFNFIISLENLDQLDSLNLFGETALFAADAQLTGNIMDIITLPGGDYAVIESNTIERFRANGQRFTTGAAPWIATPLTTGGTTCTMNVPRMMAINADGNLVVTNTGGDIINVYGITTSPVTCVSTNNTQGAVDPLAILAHTNGSVYVANNLAANSRVVQFNGSVTGAATTIWATNLAVLSTPTALAELPDGSILVSSDATDSIVRISESGTLIDSTFIQNAFTGGVLDIIVIEE